MVERLFLVVPRGYLRFVIVVFPDHNHLLFLAKSADPDEMQRYAAFYLNRHSLQRTCLGISSLQRVKQFLE